MAIQFTRVEIVGRGSGGNACCKGAYNARAIVKDERTNITYNFQKRGDNVYHIMLLPEHAHQKFKDISILMNAVERAEPQKNSQLLKDIVIALPDDKELTLQDRINITHEIIEEMEWVKNELAVQVDIHKPHDGENNWHAHLLVTTRRFTEDGKELFHKKARDLNPEFRTGKYGNFIIPEEDIIHERGKRIINRYFEKLGLENRVDLIGETPQEHIGPVRMRSVLNQAAVRNEERRIAEIEHLSTGAAVLDKVTNHMSVFDRSDLMRAVKCVPDVETRERLVEDALAHKSIVALFRRDGAETQYFTTSEIRAEEKKVLRLSSYLANGNNVFTSKGNSSFKRTRELIESARDNLSEEQHIALSELIHHSCALRILRGRAGVGKSHVLGQVAMIAKASNINVIGLSPTHKAKEALRQSGFEHTDTVKGMLFKLANGRFSLPKHSLLVVDEAGMIGNDDCQELLRVAATRKCNVILSGDERQLAPVQRGGMFKIFADIYGSSTILDIKRQRASWGKEVAMAFSKGDVRIGVSILTEENRIKWGKWQEGSRESMEALLADWHKSGEDISDRLILAVKNKDVAALNHGARQYLKAEGKLTGLELEVGGNHYMKGDRILIGKTNKELGVVNGDLGEILEVSKDRFVISIKNSVNTTDAEAIKIIEFNPSKYSDFRHGYATTVFKAQSASIKDVYVFHDGFTGIRNSYVALSRNINELNLYVNSKATPSLPALIKQLSYDPGKGISLHYLTEAESKVTKENAEFLENIGVIDSMLLGLYNFATRSITKLTDKYLPSSEYYNYREPYREAESVEKVIDRIYEQNQNIGFAADFKEERLVVGGNLISSSLNTANKEEGSNKIVEVNEVSNKGEAVDNAYYLGDVTANTGRIKQSAKARFYAKADYVRNNLQKEQQRIVWDSEAEELRREVCFKAERIARELLGEPNKNLSNRRELRFGDSGKIAVRISGEKAGTWYDFSESKGGDLFALVEHKKGGSFTECTEYLRAAVGMSPGSNLYLVNSHEASDKYVDYHKAKAEEQAIEAKKIKYAGSLYERAKNIGEKSIARVYLSEVRCISCNLGDDIKTTGIFDKTSNKKLPALVAFARDANGNITGGQQILLDSKTNNKADVSIPKKSFGKIAGSFVDVGSINETRNSVEEKEKITIIAEGLETALSVKQALLNDKTNNWVNIKVLCSLGISNISNYQAKEGEKIIIAADNDGEHAVTSKTTQAAKMVLENRGAYVEVIQPDKEGDFNDVLTRIGERNIQDSFNLAIRKYRATTLSEYIEICNKTSNSANEIKLESYEKEDLAYIRKYDLSEKDIVESYRKGENLGAVLLEQTRKSLEFAANCYRENKEIVLEAKRWGYGASEVDTVKAMLGTDRPEDYCARLWDHHLSQYVDRNVANFQGLKQEAVEPKEVIEVLKQEQSFLLNLHKEIKDSKWVPAKSKVYRELSGKIARYKSLGQLGKLINFGDKIGFEKAEELSEILKATDDFGKTHDKLVENYHKNFMASLEQSLDDIKENKVVSYDKQEWQDQLKYFEYFTKTNMSEYAPQDKINSLKPKVFESYEIQESLKFLKQRKQIAGDPIEAIEALRGEQEYLAGLHNNLQYPDYHDKNLLVAIEQAHKNEKEDIVDQLQRLGLYINKTEMKSSQITKTLKSSDNIHSALHSLTHDYQSHIKKALQGCIDDIHQGKAIEMHGKIFTCQVKFLAHVLYSQKDNEFLPHESIKQAYSQAKSYQKTMSKDFGGPSL